MPKFLDVTDPAAARAALGISEDAVSVAGYGAVGDGVADDTAAIHAARDAAGVGGKVLFPAGTYKVTNLTASVDGQVWELSGNAVVEMTTASGKCLNITADDFTLRGGVFDAAAATATNGSQHCVFAEYVDNITIEHVTVRNSPWMGIGVYNSSHVWISQCTAKNTYRDGIWVQNGDQPFISDIFITDNLVDNSTADVTDWCGGIGVRAENSNEVYRVTVKGNTAILPIPTVYQTGPYQFRKITDLVCSDNVSVGGSLAITAPLAKNATFSGNTIRNFDYCAIELPGDVNNVSVVGNVIDPEGANDPQSGVEFSSGNATNVTITGNTFYNFPERSFVGHVNFGSGSVADRVAITGNTFTLDSQNTVATYFNGTASAVTFSGNTVDGTSATNSCAVQAVRPIDGLTVTGNFFRDLTTAVVRIGPWSSAGTFNNITLSGNTYDNCPTILYNQVSGSGVVGSNVKIERSTDVQVFTSSGTWTKPEGAASVEVVCIGPGGGGGAGARGPSGTALSGGGGGGGGGFSQMSFVASDLTSTVTVTVGAGGTGAVGQASDGTAGANGSASAADTSFGNYVRAFKGASGGGGGLGVAGAASAGAGSGAGVGLIVGGVGGAGSATGAAGSPAPNSAGTTGGGAGGGITTAPAATGGGAGGWPYSLPLATAAGGNGAVGANATNQKRVGGGGGGGGGNASGAGYNGGNGGKYGGGGGGGGASLNGSTSGAGGNGGGGICIVTTYF